MTESRRAVPPLLLLAGTSEAGKSTAGQHLARCGAQRIKIRNILLALSTGIEVEHEGVATREGFDHEEFLAQLRNWVVASTKAIVVVESFIDARLALLSRQRWPGLCRIVFIDTDLRLRVMRHASANGLSEDESARIIREKDTRKRVFDQFAYWRQIADQWVENNASIASFRTTLEQIMTSTLLMASTRSAQ
jgi:dephospho-CoA kinase